MSVSLRTRILVLVVTITVSVAMVVGFANFIQARSMSRTAAEAELYAEARAISAHVKSAFQIANDNALILRNTPPIDGIIRAQANGGVDPYDGSLIQAWRERLEAIFTSHLQVQSEYTQLRFIGLADQGREIVRVNRMNGEIRVVPPSDLQRKGDEFYFRAGLEMEPASIYTSPITVNREQGAPTPDLMPTVRTVLPVFATDDHLYGMLVINADIRIVLENALAAATPTYDVYISDSHNNYIHFSPTDGIMHSEFSFEERFDPPELLSRDGDDLFDTEGFTYASYRFHTGRIGEGLEFRVLVGEPTHELMSGAYAIRQQSILLAVSLLVLTAIGSLLFVTSLTRPLGQLTQAVRSYGQNRTPMDLDVSDNDEIGELGRAFCDMIEALEENELTANTFENIIDGLILITPDGAIQAMNPAASFMFGYAENELVGQDVSVLLPDGARLERDGAVKHIPCFIDHHLVGETFEAVAKQKNSTPLHVELTLSEVQRPDTLMFSLLMRDISARKQMEVMKDEFVSTVNHELRTPLTSMLGSLSLLKKQLETKLNDDDKASMLLSMAQRSCDRLTLLVNDILDLEKIAAGKLEYRMQVVPCDDLVQDVVESHRMLGEEHGVTFKLDLQAEDPPVRLDVSRFNQALVNLMSNAAKYSPNGEVVTVSTRTLSDESIRISVSDNGPGIPEDFQARLFDRFSQADSSTTRRVGGNGLGLNITKTLIEAFDGEVSFDTTVGVGTVFHITLPIASPALAPVSDEMDEHFAKLYQGIG
ncbi:ATP-binding protein [Oceanicaulis sp.]|uniref:ATP-binding protein n=1 Tax=Oceanicaulis sp. TaxID=1924941 RepID=UPI003D2AB614